MYLKNQKNIETGLHSECRDDEDNKGDGEMKE